jgi:hypothetical protein
MERPLFNVKLGFEYVAAADRGLDYLVHIRSPNDSPRGVRETLDGSSSNGERNFLSL